MVPSPAYIGQAPSVFANAYNAYKETDGGLWVPGSAFEFPDGTWTLTRNAAGQLFCRKTAGAATTHPALSLSKLLMKIGTDPIAGGTPNIAGITGQSHDIRGVQLVSFDLVYMIGTADLTSLTPTFYRSAYVDAATVPATSNPAGTLSPTTLSPTHDATKMLVKNCACGTSFVIGNNAADVDDVLELAVVDAGSSVFDLWGIFLRFNYNIL